MDFEVIYGSIRRFDAWNVFVCIFEDFTNLKVTFEIVTFEQLYASFDNVHRFEGPSKHPVVYESAAGAFSFLKKHTPELLEHVSCGFCRYLGNLAVIRAGGTCSQG